MASAAPPKPWERSTAQTAGTTPAIASTSAVPSATTSVSNAPELPDRPATMTSPSALPSTLYGSQYGSRYGATAGGYGSYASPYSGAIGNYGSSFGGGYGSFGGGGFGYNRPYGMGAGYGAGYGFGQPYGMPDASLSQRMEAGTAATFQLIESIVGAFGGFAQMLESTYMATHSSFFAMIGVAEQFGSLRTYLGQVLSIFTLIRWVKNLVNRLLGRTVLDPTSFADFQPSGAQSKASTSAPSQPKPSKKPLLIFFLTVIGLPYLMTKLVRLITARQEEELRARGLSPADMAGLQVQHPGGGPPEIIDPASLLFVRALYPFASQEEQELSFNKDDIVAVLTNEQERKMSQWWRGRTRDGRIGWFPANYVAELPVNKSSPKVEGQPVNAMVSL